VIIVTGATGNIGRELIKLLAATKTSARAVTRDPSKIKEVGIPAVQGDFADPASLDRAFEGANHLFLLASNSPDQVKLERNAIEAAKRARFQHIVKLSALGASTASPIALGRWHGEVEAELKACGIGWTILQPQFFCQNLLGNLPTIKAEGTIYGSFGDGKQAFVDVRDIATVAFATLTQPGYMGRTYVLTGGHAYNWVEVADLVAKAAGKPVKYVDVPAEAMLGNLKGAGMPEWFARDMIGLMTYVRSGGAGELTSTVPEITRKPARTMAEFVSEHAALFKG
jgi:NAD(P)H dehydrogenase (quinone)